MSAYDVVLKSREKGRPTAVRYISNIVEGFIELHGDRRFADDRALHTTSAAPIPKATARRCV